MDDDLLDDLEDIAPENDASSVNSGSDDDDDVVSKMAIAHKALLDAAAATEDVNTLLKVFSSTQMADTLSEIIEFQEITTQPDVIAEYPTIVCANFLAFEIEHEGVQVQKFIRDHYSPRFPELASLILNPLEYCKTVKLIANEMDVSNVDLKSILAPAIVMIINITNTTSEGRRLTETELNRVIEACDVALDMDRQRSVLLKYVETRMQYIAPNLTALVGAALAAQLIGIAGGVKALSVVPACNLLVLGRLHKTNLGLSTVYMGKHQGVIYQSDLVKQCPNDLKRKAARIVSAKAVLCIRIDLAGGGSYGQTYRDDVLRKIGLLLQPPPSRKTKALPLPKEFKKKRGLDKLMLGGRRARQLKERNSTTTLQKQQNRMAFGEQEEEVGYGDEIVGMGLIGGGSGKIRVAKAEVRKVGLSKKHKNFKGNNAIVATGLNAVAFSANEIQLENPDIAASKAKPANDRYFGNGFKKT